ncbi:cell division protein ZapD [Ottowia testudinis]|uniref:Cell division protein ZapD n=1 Tax=Ottowia testudinis TaxID=2816950 RepID=A0A975H6K9_9BURK|nr:cell division protein ZapD [Ottowia testudinis]QTD46112.1 cell division protein ZapD [Ottowia testudinis]
MILYEYPFNERIRTYLRLEHLFGRLGQLLARDAALDHHFALITIFEVMDVTSRADLKSEALKDLEKQKVHIATYRGNPAISEVSLDAILARLEGAFQHLSRQHGKPGHDLTDNEWLMSIRSRAAIPGGTCGFDLPAYHAWQQSQSAARRADLHAWAATLAPMAEAITLLLQILRDSGKPQKMMAVAGQFQQTLPQGRTFQLLRLRIDESMQLIPEISGNRLMASVRLMRQDADGKLHLAREDAPFELALCA